MKRSNILLLLFFLLLASGCSESKVINLASVELVAPKLLEPGEVLRIKGNGFVQGPAQVTLDGTLTSHGEKIIKSGRFVLSGNAVSESVVELRVTSGIMSELTDEPTKFKGAIEVSFPVYQSEAAVDLSARKVGVELDLRPAGGGVAAAARKTRNALKFLDELGIELVEPESQEGMLVVNVRNPSAAASAGLKYGDRLLTLDGQTLTEAADLSNTKYKSSYNIGYISREGEMQRATLSVQNHAVLELDELIAIVLSSISLGLFLAFSAPLARWSGRPLAPSVNPALRFVGFGVISLFLAILPAVLILCKAGYSATFLLAGLSVFALTPRLFSKQPITLGHIGSFLAHSLPCAAIIFCAGACGSSLSLWDIVTGQQGAAWHAWSSPFSLVAVLGSLSLIWPEDANRNKYESRFSAIMNWTASLSSSSLVTLCCFGGWLIPGIQVSRLADSGWMLAVACTVFLVKTWIVMVIARWIASVGAIERRAQVPVRNPALPVAICIASTGLATWWMWVEISIPYRAAGEVLAIAAWVTFFTVISIAILGGTRRFGMSAISR